jgi:Lon protease-like protein
MIGKGFRDRLADAHRRPRNHRNFACQFHVRLLVAGRSEVKLRLYNLCTASRFSWQTLGGFVGSLLPLFPLDVVLFPAAPLPLHIFEPRYKEMIGECLEQKQLFGVVRAQETNLADVGCTAEIIAVTKTYDDGRLDIVTQGRERFEILGLNQDRAFLRGEILYVTDEPGKPSEQEIAHAVDLHRQILALANSEQDLPAEEDSLLSFHLAGSLPLDLDFKQKMLSLRSEAQRIQSVITYFEGILPNLRRAVTARQKAGGNGHAR